MKSNPYMGPAPRIMASNLPMIALCLIPTVLKNPWVNFNAIPAAVRLIAAVGLMALGLSLVLYSGLQVVKGVNEKRLITGGPFKLVRNPMYSAYIFLIIPGLSLLINSWIFLTVGLTLYRAALHYIRELPPGFG